VPDPQERPEDLRDSAAKVLTGGTRSALLESAAAAMPDAEAVALPGLGHLQAFWKTGMSIPPIERFLARLGAGGPDWR
jgi:hypothetical protein